jgi:hypothetical protein
LAAFACALCVCSSGFAQVFYEPVQYQFGTESNRYCYGGSDPRIHAVASSPSQRPHYGGVNLHRFDGGNTFNQPSPMSPRPRVFSDCVPLQDASWFGYTCADARNAAFANAPTYFRKADLLAHAIVTADGARIVPAAAPRVMMTPAPTYMPMPAQRGQINIIPKRLLDRPLKDFEQKPKTVASATP